MSINPYYHYMLSISGQKEKESYFQKAWGKLNLLSRDAGRRVSREFRAANVEMRAVHNQQVLSTFNGNSVQDEHADQLNAIASEMLTMLETERQAQVLKRRELKAFNRSVQILIEQIVEHLVPYAGLLNKAVGHTELRTVITGPETVVEEILRPGLEDVEYKRDFRARLSTSTWSLLLRGVDSRIDVFLIPVDKVLRLTKVEAFYRPAAQLNARLDDGLVIWELDGERLTETRLKSFFIDLYQQLLDRTRTQVLKQRGLCDRNPALEYTYASECTVDQGRYVEDFDYRVGEPELFGPDDCVEPALDKTQIELLDKTQYLLSESDFQGKPASRPKKSSAKRSSQKKRKSK